MTDKSEMAQFAKDRGWTQCRLAEEMGYDPRMVQKHMKRQRNGEPISKNAIRAFERVKLEYARSEAIGTLVAAQRRSNIESAHIDADMALVGILTALGEQEIVNEWTKVEKWYR